MLFPPELFCYRADCVKNTSRVAFFLSCHFGFEQLMAIAWRVQYKQASKLDWQAKNNDLLLVIPFPEFAVEREETVV